MPPELSSVLYTFLYNVSPYLQVWGHASTWSPAPTVLPAVPLIQTTTPPNRFPSCVPSPQRPVSRHHHRHGRKEDLLQKWCHRVLQRNSINQQALLRGLWGTITDITITQPPSLLLYHITSWTLILPLLLPQVTRVTGHSWENGDWVEEGEGEGVGEEGERGWYCISSSSYYTCSRLAYIWSA